MYFVVNSYSILKALEVKGEVIDVWNVVDWDQTQTFELSFYNSNCSKRNDLEN